jgi:hypothetical protein
MGVACDMQIVRAYDRQIQSPSPGGLVYFMGAPEGPVPAYGVEDLHVQLLEGIDQNFHILGAAAGRAQYGPAVKMDILHQIGSEFDRIVSAGRIESIVSESDAEY